MPDDYVSAKFLSPGMEHIHKGIRRTVVYVHKIVDHQAPFRFGDDQVDIIRLVLNNGTVLDYHRNTPHLGPTVYRETPDVDEIGF